MASTRRLLVLMLCLLPWLQMVESGFSVQRFQSARPITSPVPITKDGVYLISVIVDPCRGCYSRLHLFCDCQGTKRYFFTAYGKSIYSHAEVAVGLKKTDTLFIKRTGNVEGPSSLSVVYVAELSSFYSTVMNGRVTKNSPVTYTTRLTPNGWIPLKNMDRETTFTVPVTGMYWVTGRTLPMSTSVFMEVKSGPRSLFLVCAEDTKPVSASGAFRLTAGSTVWATTQGGVTYAPHTLISAVYLAGNKKPNTYPYEHLAFTATYDKQLYSAPGYVLQFRHVLTNYGYLYVDGYTEIRRSGSYMVSIRPDPITTPTTVVSLFVNGQSRWDVYAEDGIPSGATISITLQAGSYVAVKHTNSITTILEDGTMFSIAFIQP